jgi:hypothetical protein
MRNVLVLAKENECLDFGGWRYGLDWIGWRGRGYRYFVFLNSSVRGPYVPLYVPRAIHWTTLFTQLIRESGDGYGDNNGPIKLVGMTINCHLHRPHVQSMLWVTDYVIPPRLFLVCVVCRVPCAVVRVVSLVGSCAG